jgi:hypothetical protein
MQKHKTMNEQLQSFDLKNKIKKESTVKLYFCFFEKLK